MKNIRYIVSILTCLLTLLSCEDEYMHYEREISFVANNNIPVHGFSTDGSFLQRGYRMLFETTATNDYFMITVPNLGISESQAKDWIVYESGELTSPAVIRNIQFVFSLSHGKFSDKSQYTTNSNNLTVELYAYDGFVAKTSRYAYHIKVKNAGLEIDTFHRQGGDCNKMKCSGTFNIESELLIYDTDGNEIARTSLNLSNGIFKCLPKLYE